MNKQYIACAAYNGSRVALTYFSPDTPESDLPSFDLPESNVLEFYFDQGEGNLFIISNVSAYSPGPTSVLHMYKLYNVFNWEFTVDLALAIPRLSDFRFRAHDQMSFFSQLQQGTLISEKT